MHKTNTKVEKKNLKDSKYYINRELSLLEFQYRVLMEAADTSHPLLERLKFINIFSSNLDEFFMIRVAGLKSQAAAGVLELSYDGMTPREQLREIRKRTEPLYKMQADILIKDILPALKNEGIHLHYIEELTQKEKDFLKNYFLETVLPVLTPLSLGPANPFPRLINCSLNVAFILIDTISAEKYKRVAFVQIPSFVSRFVRLPNKNGNHFVLVEQVIKEFAEILFQGFKIEQANTFRVTRDADIEIAEDEAEDLLSELAEQIKYRRWGRAAVRLEVSTQMPEYLTNILMNSLELEPQDVYVFDRPFNLPDFMQLLKLDIRKLKDIPFATANIPNFISEEVSIFDAIKESNYLVHHPFDSFTTSTLKLISDAASDAFVKVIKITLYRTGLNSDIVEALKRAAENGKYVTAFVELKARFDEEKNIVWAKELEQAGVHVVYGVIGLKTHSKIAQIVRQEDGKLKTYLHLATGNYNQVTARLYTDIGYFTSNPEFADDSIHLFNYLTGYSYINKWKHLAVAPINLYETIVSKIKREIKNHTPENPGLIIAKINSLAHRNLIPLLYEASQAGVEIRLIVRGICCLRPEIPGVSDNIKVKSILGRFLEHSRIFYFKNGGDDEFYLSSADWMSRNMHRRVEIMFPVLDEKSREELRHILDIYWADNLKSWTLQADGIYIQSKPGEGEKEIIAQSYFLNRSQKFRNME